MPSVLWTKLVCRLFWYTSKLRIFFFKCCKKQTNEEECATETLCDLKSLKYLISWTSQKIFSSAWITSSENNFKEHFGVVKF